MATKEQIEEVSKEADAVIGAKVSLEAAGMKTPDVDYLPSEKPGTTTVDLKAAIRELAAIARSHSPMMQDARVAELLVLAD